MQSGISSSVELHEAFNKFVADTTLFCLPVTITNEQLLPLPTIPFANSHSAANDINDAAFFSSLPSLSSVLQPKTAIYLLIRRPSTSGIVPLTYVPSNSPVRSKTLFASTRATIVRELGSEKFTDSVFAVEEEEVLSESEWRERDADKKATRGGEDEDERRREQVMGDQERELHRLNKEESQERSMSHRRDIGMGGNAGGKGSGVPMNVGEGVVDALLEMRDEEGNVVVVTIDVPTESFVFSSKQSNVSPAQLQGHISDTKPQYTFYRYPNTQALVFIYTCPPRSSIKERMLNASSRRSLINLAQSEGVIITHKIEASGPEDITKDRLDEEVNPPKAAETQTRGFARPKRPGR